MQPALFVDIKNMLCVTKMKGNYGIFVKRLTLGRNNVIINGNL